MSSPTPTPARRRLVPFVLLGLFVAWYAVSYDDPRDDIPAGLIERAEFLAGEADLLADDLGDAADVTFRSYGQTIYAGDLANNLAADANQLANNLADGADDLIRWGDLMDVGILGEHYADLAKGLDSLAANPRLHDPAALAKTLGEDYADLADYLTDYVVDVSLTKGR